MKISRKLIRDVTIRVILIVKGLAQLRRSYQQKRKKQNKIAENVSMIFYFNFEKTPCTYYKRTTT